MATLLPHRFSWIFFVVCMLASLASQPAYAQSCPTIEGAVIDDKRDIKFESCPGAEDGAVTITMTDGIAPYAFKLYIRVGLTKYDYVKESGEVAGNSYTFTGLKKGNYRIEIYDSQVDDCIPINSKGFIIGTTGTTPPDVSISGPAEVCENQTGVSYTVPLTAGSSYSWSVPAGASIVSGENGPENNTIVVNVGTSSGQIKVIETNSGGCSGKEASFDVTVASPPAVFAMDPTGTASFCEGSAGAAIGLNGSESGVTYSLLRNGAVVASANGTGSAITFGTFNELGTYTVSAKANTASGCTEAMDGQLILNALAYPVAPQASTPAPICQGDDVDPITITPSDPGFSIRIFRDAALTDEITGAGTSFDPDSDAPYYDKNTAATYTYYIAQDNGGCLSEATVVNVVVHALPTATFASSSLEVCEEKDGVLTVNFTGQQPFSFVYNDGSQDITVSDIAASSYTIPVRNVTADRVITIKAVSDGNSCGQENLDITAQVTKLDKPEVSLTLSTTEACREEGGVFVLSGGLPEGGTYFVNGVATNQILLDADITEDKIYTILYRYADARGCENEATAEFTLHPLPQLSFSMPKTSFCAQDDAVELESFASPAGGTFSGTGVFGRTFHPKRVEPGTYVITYTYEDANGCSASTSLEVTVAPMLDAEVFIEASKTTLCEGEEVSFRVVAASSSNLGENPGYAWLVNGVVVSNDPIFTTTELVDLANVQLLLTQGSLLCGSGNTASSNSIENIKVNARPLASWTSSNQEICAEGSAVLELNISSGTAPFTLTYSATTASGTQTFTESFATAGANSFTVAPQSSTTYRLLSLKDVNECENTLTGEVTVNVIPTQDISVSISPMTPVVCPDEAIAFTASVNNWGEGVTYQWFLNGEALAGETTDRFELKKPGHNDEVWVVVEQGTIACPGAETTANSGKAKVSIKEADATFTGPASVCIINYADYVPTVAGGSFSLVPNEDGSNLTASIDAATGRFTATAAGEYTIVYSISQNGCTATDSLTVTGTPAVDPTVSLQASSTRVCEGETVHFTAQAQDENINLVYTWLVNGNVVADSISSTLTLRNIRGASLQVEVRVKKAEDEPGCISDNEASASVTITLNERPVVALSISGEDTICNEGDETKLLFTISGGTAPYTIVYSDGSSNYTLVMSGNTHEEPVSPSATTTYSIVSLQDSESCTAAEAALPQAVEVKVITAPATPVAAPATDITCTSFTASWNAIEGAISYRVELAATEDFATILQTKEVSAPERAASFEGLTAGTQYFYRLRAVNSCGESDASASVGVTTTVLEQADLAFAITPASVADQSTMELSVVTTSGFNGLNSLEFTASWAVADKLAYMGVLSSALEGATLTVDQESGTIAVRWSSTNPLSLAAGASLFTLEFKAEECGEVDFSFGAVQAVAAECPVNFSTTDRTQQIEFGGQPLAQAATNVSCTGFTANWRAVAGADSYQLEVADNANFSGSSMYTAISTTSHDVPNLNTGTRYYYRVKAISSSCGEGPFSEVIQVDTPSGDVIERTASACQGKTLTFSIDPIDGATYSWTGPNGYTGTTNALEIENAQEIHAGVYTLLVTTAGCVTTYEVSATVSAPVANTLALSLTEGQELHCASTEAAFTATLGTADAGATFTWYLNNEFRAETDANTYTIAGIAHGDSVKVVFYPAIGCPAADSLVAKMKYTLPAALAPEVTEGEAEICFGEPLVATSSNGQSLQWTVMLNGETVHTENSARLAYTPEAAGTYTVSATQASEECDESDAYTYTVQVKEKIEKPTIVSQLQNVQVCADEELPQISASGSNISWYADAALQQLVNRGNVLQPAVLEAGETALYYAVAEAAGCRSEAVKVTLHRLMPLVVNLGGDQALCAPATVTLAAGYDPASYSIRWSTGEETATITVSTTGTYSVTVTDRVTGCAGTDAVLIEIENEFTPSVAIEEITISCGMEQIVLKALPTYGGPSPTYQWYNWVTGEPIEGATAQEFVLYDASRDESPTFRNGDSYYVKMQSSLECVTVQTVDSDPFQILLPMPEAPEFDGNTAELCQGEGNTLIIEELNGAVMRWYYNAANQSSPRIDNSLIVYEGKAFAPSAEDYTVGTHVFWVTQYSALCGESLDWVAFTLTVTEDECEIPACELSPRLAVHILPGNEICSDVTAVQLQADVEAGENPQYAWYYNNAASPFSTEGSPVFTSEGGFRDGDSFRLEITITDEAYICNGQDKISAEATITLVEQLQATVAISPIEPVCAQSTSPVTLSAEGEYLDWSQMGLATTFVWTIDGREQTTTTNQITVVPADLTAGVVTLTVILPEEVGCVLAPAPVSFTIPFAEQQAFTVSLSSSAPNGACPGTAITFTASAPDAGEDPVYTFFTRGTNGVVREEQSGRSNSFVLNNPQHGQQVYAHVRVTDPAVLCVAPEATSQEVVVRVLTSEECVGSPVSCEQFTIEVTELVRPSCGLDNGKLVYYITSRTSPFRLSYSLGDRIVQEQVNSPYVLTVDNIPALQNLQVVLGEGANRCVFNYLLEQAPRLDITFEKLPDGDIVCHGENTGKARLTVNGGNAPYQYLLEGATEWQTLNGNTIVFNTLPAGIVNILVRDNADDTCPDVASVEILNLNQRIEIKYEVTQQANCNDNIGVFRLMDVSGGSTGNGYRVKLASEETWTDFTPGMQFPGLARGRHILNVTDGVCIVNRSIVIPSPGLIALSEESGVMNFTCERPDLRNGIFLKIDGSITEVAGPYVADFFMMNSQGQYQLIASEELFNGNGELYKFQLERGSYRVEVRNINREGCPEVAEYVIEGSEIPVPITYLAEEQSIYCEGASGGVLITNLKGAAGLRYEVEFWDADGNLALSKTITTFEYATQESFEILGLPKGLYRMLIKQDQGLCNTIETSQPFELLIRETERKLAVSILGKTLSFPERATGSLSLRVANGSGTAPYTASLVWMDRVEDQEDWVFASYDDAIPYNATTGRYDLTYHNLPPGVYELTVVDAKGCVVVITETIMWDTSLFIPNIITPNGDGSNEVFYIRNKPARTQLTITNRWGKTVYESADYQNDWDGDTLPEGIYFYSIKAPQTENGIHKGWLEIRRGARPN
jgi:gliding motility-associated-like protein